MFATRPCAACVFTRKHDETENEDHYKSVEVHNPKRTPLGQNPPETKKGSFNSCKQERIPRRIRTFPAAEDEPVPLHGARRRFHVQESSA